LPSASGAGDALIIQNAVRDEEGLGRLQAVRKGFGQTEPPTRISTVQIGLVREPASARQRFAASERYNPDLWKDEAAFPGPAGRGRYPIDLFLRLPQQSRRPSRRGRIVRERRPPTLIVWGRYDPRLRHRRVAALKKDLPKAEVHLLDARTFRA